MDSYKKLIENNREWVARTLSEDPHYFDEMAKGQSPKFLFLGCSDSRVTIADMTGANQGELFVHRNIANQVSITDLNFLSVLEYSIEVLKVLHIVVLGHYQCGGVKAAMMGTDLPLVGNWVNPIRKLYNRNLEHLSLITDERDRFDKLCEMNTIDQVRNIYNTPAVAGAIGRKQSIKLHAWIFNIYNGKIKALRTGLPEWVVSDEAQFFD